MSFTTNSTIILKNDIKVFIQPNITISDPTIKYFTLHVI